MVLKENRDIEMRTNGRNGNVREIHIAVIGANGSGKSALTVKYMTKRYISEYDPNLEDTYCKHETINGHECMLWIMDTVEGPHRDPNRYLPWADIIFVVYSINNRFSFDYAEILLKTCAQHDHSICVRQHILYLIGNKTDLDRYRQVSKSQGTLLATTYGAELFETNTTEEYVLVKTIFHHAISEVISRSPATPTPSIGPISSDNEIDRNDKAQARKPKLTRSHRHIFDHSPSPKQYGSDPEQSTTISAPAVDTLSLKRTLMITRTPSPRSTLQRRSKSPSARFVFHRHQSAQEQQPRNEHRTLSPPKKSSSAMKLLQLFK